MDQNEIKFLNLENELLSTRKKLNDLIYEYSQADRTSPEAVNTALYQDKINYLETELKYLGNQLQILKNMQNVQSSQPVQNVQSVQISQPAQNAQSIQSPQPVKNAQPKYAAGINTVRKPQDYEKLFGKNFMGIFASVLIFISLIIFATLIIPHLTDTMKMIGMYLVSFGIFGGGYALYKKNNQNNFYIALIGCGAGSLYLSLLLSNLYFKRIDDIALYLLILVWTVFVKYLTRIKNFVFMIIGQCGIFIAMVLGTLLCVSEKDSGKFLVLIIFYMISSFVFSNLGKAYLRFLVNFRRNDTSEEIDAETFYYEDNLFSHICKFLNLTVITLGLSMMPVKWDSLKITCVIFMMLYLLLEFYIAYKEECRHGLVFQILTIADSFLFICLFEAVNFYAMDATYLLMYLVSLALLFYVNKKGERAGFKVVSEIYCFFMLYLGCSLNPFIREHLYAYLTVIPFMLYGVLKKKRLYLYTSILYIAQFLFLIMSLSSTYFLKTELLIMIVICYSVFLYSCKKTEETWFKIAGYLVLCFITFLSVNDFAHATMLQYMIQQNGIHSELMEKAYLISFITVAVIHLILCKLDYFGKEKPVENMMYGITALWMVLGCHAIYYENWKLLIILITILLFIINSKKLLSKHKYAGYYVAFKYTALMICILNSFEVVNYIISISLLLFAIVSIIAGFYINNTSFRLYGLVLSMISIFKLIMIDIQYDSTIENAVSFFVSGVLCFIISFIYNKIDTNFKKGNPPDSGSEE